ncbi:ABC transporter permease [Ammoniphilus sp. YIM 78166]|uniref:ABC transporter permease n=1 Tax=Ammoniphilus sp. YIM 78166 TaxID=1644106 RepID=UPI0010700AC8|nr:ABC transporter permease [Ammoniphilus sp. YIM 78166]
MSIEVAAQPNDLDKEKRNPVVLFLSYVWVMIELEGRKLKKDPTDLVMRAIQPALWLLIFGQALSGLREIPTGGATYLEFLAPGILAQSITYLSIFYGIMIIWDRESGVLQKILSTPIYRSAFVLGKMLSASLRCCIQAIMILFLSVVIGVQFDWGLLNLLGLFFTVILGGAFFAGLSMLIAFIVRTRERMMGIGQLITLPLFFASNALYPITIMPNWLQVIATINPLSYLVDALRGLLLLSHTANVLLDWGVLLAASCGMLIICSILSRRLTN